MSNATLFEIGAFHVNSVMTTSLAITAVVSVVAIAGTRNLKERQPGRLQSALEYVVGGLRDFMAVLLARKRQRLFCRCWGLCFCILSYQTTAACCRLPESCQAFSRPRARLAALWGWRWLLS